jgi:hypothetical protein
VRSEEVLVVLPVVPAAVVLLVRASAALGRSFRRSGWVLDDARADVAFPDPDEEGGAVHGCLPLASSE